MYPEYNQKQDEGQNQDIDAHINAYKDLSWNYSSKGEVVITDHKLQGYNHILPACFCQYSEVLPQLVLDI